MNSLLSRLEPGVVGKLNLLADLFCLLASLSVFTLAAQGVSGFTGGWMWFAVVACLMWTLTTTVFRYYSPWVPHGPVDDALLGSALALGLVVFLGLVSLASSRFPSMFELALLFWPAVIGTRRVTWKSSFSQLEPADDVLIVGTGPLARATAADLRKGMGKRHVVGHLRWDGEREVPGMKVLGDASELEQVLRRAAVDEIFLAGNPGAVAGQMEKAIAVCEKFGMPFAVPAQPYRLHRARCVNERAIGDGYLHYVAVETKPYQMALKRLFDIFASGLAVFFLMPLFIGVAIAIKLTSKGPVFFKQLRVGMHGRPFHMLKFRSMVTNAEELKAKLSHMNEQSGPVFKMKNDPRVTSIGRFIRKFSIDELPQLINVLRGEMSVVGPRPPVPSEVERYEGWQRRRLSVRPGLTCIWQVSGRNEISFEEWMYLDMQYIDHWSLRNDFNLILKTVPVVLTGRGAS